MNCGICHEKLKRKGYRVCNNNHRFHKNCLENGILEECPQCLNSDSQEPPYISSESYTEPSNYEPYTSEDYENYEPLNYEPYTSEGSVISYRTKRSRARSQDYSHGGLDSLDLFKIKYIDSENKFIQKFAEYVVNEFSSNYSTQQSFDRLEKPFLKIINSIKKHHILYTNAIIALLDCIDVVIHYLLQVQKGNNEYFLIAEEKLYKNADIIRHNSRRISRAIRVSQKIANKRILKYSISGLGFNKVMIFLQNFVKLIDGIGKLKKEIYPNLDLINNNSNFYDTYGSVIDYVMQISNINNPAKYIKIYFEITKRQLELTYNNYDDYTEQDPYENISINNKGIDMITKINNLIESTININELLTYIIFFMIIIISLAYLSLFFHDKGRLRSKNNLGIEF